MADKTAPRRLDRRRERTRNALVHAAQRLLAERRTDVAIQEITELADVGVGSFYNHFDSKEDLFRVAVAEALEWWGATMDRLTADLEDPAVAYAQSFRMTGRLHRRHPELSRILLHHGLELAHSDRGLAPRAHRDIRAAVAAGRFRTEDPDLALALTAGAVLSLGALLHAQPDRDAGTSADLVARGLLRQFGIPAEEAARICALDLPDLDLVDTITAMDTHATLDTHTALGTHAARGTCTAMDGVKAMDGMTAPETHASMDGDTPTDDTTTPGTRTPMDDTTAPDARTAMDRATAMDTRTAMDRATAPDTRTPMDRATAPDTRTPTDDTTAPDTRTPTDDTTAPDTRTAMDRATAPDTRTPTDDTTTPDTRTAAGPRAPVDTGTGQERPRA